MMKEPIATKLKLIAKRWLVVRTACSHEVSMTQPGWAISLLRGRGRYANSPAHAL